MRKRSAPAIASSRQCWGAALTCEASKVRATADGAIRNGQICKAIIGLTGACDRRRSKPGTRCKIARPIFSKTLSVAELAREAHRHLWVFGLVEGCETTTGYSPDPCVKMIPF